MTPLRNAGWDRTDGRALEWLLGLGAALVAVFSVIIPLLGVFGVLDGGASSRIVGLRSATTAQDTGGADGMTLTGTHQAELSFAQPDLAQRTLLVLPELFTGVMLLVIAYLLFCTVRTVRTGDPFVPANARRVAGIAGAVLAMGVTGPVLDMITTAQLVGGTVADQHVVAEGTFSAAPILLGLLIAALSEVFRRGARLRADTEGLV
ncbi:DUF2975 domain-containing protein [Streptomyces paludis]|uniref:DUF2975 domain-containing protein n=1 Tax=Streptomyces paludis TaxID=2282738 RepID=A0A345HZZ4_9ACTN|nr:DUF2975 domain-containing protein [Streptomyces paludis]AXG82268.1 DUF2975 domain-containing protein [Streptomyces paludis]